MNRSFDDHPFIRACRGLPHDRVPVWFMRQAGRSLPEYRAIRGTGTILDAIADPDLSTEITLQPVRRYDVDAAILYSDIVVPAHAVGFGLTVTPGVGPEVERPFRHEDDLARLRPLDPEADTPYVLETVRQLVAELDVSAAQFACCVELGSQSVDTKTNAIEARDWLARNGYDRDVTLVTSDWHMRRAAFEFRRALPEDMHIVYDAVPTEPGFGTLFAEYNKYVLRRVGLWVGL